MENIYCNNNYVIYFLDGEIVEYDLLRSKFQTLLHYNRLHNFDRGYYKFRICDKSGHMKWYCNHNFLCQDSYYVLKMLILLKHSWVIISESADDYKQFHEYEYGFIKSISPLGRNGLIQGQSKCGHNIIVAVRWIKNGSKLLIYNWRKDQLFIVIARSGKSLFNLGSKHVLPISLGELFNVNYGTRWLTKCGVHISWLSEYKITIWKKNYGSLIYDINKRQFYEIKILDQIVYHKLNTIYTFSSGQLRVYENYQLQRVFSLSDCVVDPKTGLIIVAKKCFRIANNGLIVWNCGQNYAIDKQYIPKIIKRIMDLVLCNDLLFWFLPPEILHIELYQGILETIIR